MAGLLIVAVVGAVLVLYAADRVLKARTRGRRLRTMSDRLAAAATRGEEQHERREAAAHASAALTSFMPAIKRPPLSLPDVPSPGAKRSGAGQQEHGSAHGDQRPSRNGEHAARAAGLAGRETERPADPGTRKGHPTGPRRPIS